MKALLADLSEVTQTATVIHTRDESQEGVGQLRHR